MPVKFEKLRGLLACPDDGSQLDYSGNAFVCPACRRHFRPLECGLLELLPSTPTTISGLNSEYAKGYVDEFNRLFRRGMAAAWGASADSSWLRKRERHMRWSSSLLANGQDTRSLVLADFSAGSGLYTFSYASQFRLVLHCDLSVDNLNYSITQAEAAGVQNVAFLRIDYFRPPFRSSLSRVICFDTLIRGEEHERVLLRGILGSVSPSGFALVDFHNWNHNPLRRIGLLAENFAHNRSYTRRELYSLLASAGSPVSECFRFHQEFEPGSRAASLLSHLLPAVRFVYRLHAPDHLLRASAVAQA